jgi:ubiquinone/menaquinone biosynthesis C-methylase UbiE
MHEANRKGWDAAAGAGLADFRCEINWRECHRNPGLILDERELKWLRGLRGKKACVLGSGDNRVVFALAGLGAGVTSVDISGGQLDVARQRAAQLGLPVRFLRADVTDLSAIENDTFDLVYTGGHVAVWVSDLRGYYAEAARILRPGGLFLVNEYHPFRRIWDEKARHLTISAGPSAST